MTTVQITLPDQLAQEAQSAGLLSPSTMERMLREQLKTRRVNELFEAMDRMAAVDIPPMTMQEIQAEVDAVRKARRERAGRS